MPLARVELQMVSYSSGNSAKEDRDRICAPGNSRSTDSPARSVRLGFWRGLVADLGCDLRGGARSALGPGFPWQVRKSCTPQPGRCMDQSPRTLHLPRPRHREGPFRPPGLLAGDAIVSRSVRVSNRRPVIARVLRASSIFPELKTMESWVAQWPMRLVLNARCHMPRFHQDRSGNSLLRYTASLRLMRSFVADCGEILVRDGFTLFSQAGGGTWETFQHWSGFRLS